MPLLTPPPDRTIALSLLEWRATLADEQERAIVKARAYHDGEQLVFLTDRLRQFLSLSADQGDATFRMNVCRIVVEAVAERLVIEGFDCPDPVVKAWAEQAWHESRMDAVADDVHEQAVRDGEAFGFVYWDAEDKRVRVVAHPRYTSVGAGGGGDGFGCLMFYPDDDPSQKPLRAVKRWVEIVGGSDYAEVQRQRATVYYPDRVEKYFYDGGAWRAITDPSDDAWPIPWVDRAGRPLGIPIIHFKNKGLRSEGWDAIPIQDAINKTLVDLLASADLTAFRIFVALGFIPTTDGKPPNDNGSNALTIGPGQMIGTTENPGSTDFKAIDGADLSPTLTLLQNLCLYLAMVTDTPISRFQVTGLIAAEGTLKQQDEPLLAKVRSRQVIFGDAWEDTMATARRIQNMFGSASVNEDPMFTARWGRAQSRSDAEQQAEWKVKKELGVPRRTIWAEMGYKQEQIDAMWADPETQFGAGYPGMALPPAGDGAGASGG